MTHQLIALIVAGAAMIGCRTSSDVVVWTGSFADDSCAVMLRIEADVVETEGRPVERAEVWELRHVDPDSSNARALRLGFTDAQGRLETSYCYMASGPFKIWNPSEEPVRLRFMIVRDGFGMERIDIAPPVEEVLAAGNLMGAPPGALVDWSKIDTIPLSNRSYRVAFRAVLCPTGL